MPGFCSSKHFCEKSIQMTWMRRFYCVLTLQWASISDSWTHETSSKVVAMDPVFEGKQGKDACSFSVGQQSGRNNTYKICLLLLSTRTSGGNFIITTPLQSGSAAEWHVRSLFPLEVCFACTLMLNSEKTWIVLCTNYKKQ